MSLEDQATSMPPANSVMAIARQANGTAGAIAGEQEEPSASSVTPLTSPDPQTDSASDPPAPPEQLPSEAAATESLLSEAAPLPAPSEPHVGAASAREGNRGLAGEVAVLLDRRDIEAISGWLRPASLKAMRRLLHDLHRKDRVVFSQRDFICALLLEGPANASDLRALVLRDRERQRAAPRSDERQENYRVMVPRALKERYEDMVADLAFDEDFRTSLREVLDALLGEAPQTVAEARELHDRQSERVYQAEAAW